jgi:hypothetical protein
MTQRELRFRPLSEGIGLGSLKSTPFKKQQKYEMKLPENPQQDLPVNQPEIDTSMMRQAHAAYAPHSVGSQIRARAETRFIVSFMRFMTGFGTDIFVGCFTALVLAWAGVLAWNAGAGGALSGNDAFFSVLNFIGSVTLSQALIGLLVSALCWRLVRILVFR